MSKRVPHIRTIAGRGSWRTRALNEWLRWASRKPLGFEDDVAALRRRYELLDARHFKLDPSVRREAVNCNGVAAEWISVPQTRPGRTILYMHGGSFAFRFPNAHASFAARLCRRLGASALMPDYRLAPEHPFPAAPDDCQASYRWLLSQGCRPEQLLVVGDSAGGNLALVTLHRSLLAKEPMPACAVLLSPAVDCTLDSPSMAVNEARDPMFSLRNLLVLRRLYVPSPQLYTHPDVSPLFADFAGFPPLFLQAGQSEMLCDEAIRLAHKAHDSGVDVELELWPETPHLFQMAAFLPEAARAMDEIEKFVCARMA
ncbi:alpha/beta hydrolase [Paucibacter sp. B2R-40]|uniref:alpha/beta hydrolase n=1 Tax=Paucibacter sp. B2R-40 TaxID=2893554 RepID=UPI0021E36231|nr:alpha/beta hydrolase [Paucibacter sp. B2R-40]MCV2355641.1 alpha/beta hydrolase [Paucibacter sp. B2R-40]